MCLWSPLMSVCHVGTEALASYSKPCSCSSTPDKLGMCFAMYAWLSLDMEALSERGLVSLTGIIHRAMNIECRQNIDATHTENMNSRDPDHSQFILCMHVRHVSSHVCAQCAEVCCASAVSRSDLLSLCHAFSLGMMLKCSYQKVKQRSHGMGERTSTLS